MLHSDRGFHGSGEVSNDGAGIKQPSTTPQINYSTVDSLHKFAFWKKKTTNPFTVGLFGDLMSPNHDQ